jgi:hypothetical protein
MWNSPVSETFVWATLTGVYAAVVAHAISSTGPPTSTGTNKKAAARAAEPAGVLSSNEATLVGVGMVVFQLEWLGLLLVYDVSAPEQVRAVCVACTRAHACVRACVPVVVRIRPSKAYS